MSISVPEYAIYDFTPGVSDFCQLVVRLFTPTLTKLATGHDSIARPVGRVNVDMPVRQKVEPSYGVDLLLAISDLYQLVQDQSVHVQVQNIDGDFEYVRTVCKLQHQPHVTVYSGNAPILQASPSIEMGFWSIPVGDTYPEWVKPYSDLVFRELWHVAPGVKMPSRFIGSLAVAPLTMTKRVPTESSTNETFNLIIDTSAQHYWANGKVLVKSLPHPT